MTHYLTPLGGIYPDKVNEGDRPVVVIDPENREQVEAFTNAMCPYYPLGSRGLANKTDSVQGALRSLLTPPKPDEPKGLGAVVVDTEGTRWVRTEGPPAKVRGYVWVSAFSTALPDRAVNRPYSEINAVRVLSKGVTP